MESVLMIVIFVLFAVLTDKKGEKKKTPLPLPRQSMPPQKKGEGLGFQIPELRNAPGTVYREPGTILSQQMQDYQQELAARKHEEEYKQQRLLEEQQIRAAEQAAYEEQAKLSEMPAPRPGWNIPVLTPESARQAVVLAEILGNPKAYRRHR